MAIQQGLCALAVPLLIGLCIGYSNHCFAAAARVKVDDSKNQLNNGGATPDKRLLSAFPGACDCESCMDPVDLFVFENKNKDSCHLSNSGHGWWCNAHRTESCDCAKNTKSWMPCGAGSSHMAKLMSVVSSHSPLYPSLHDDELYETIDAYKIFLREFSDAMKPQMKEKKREFLSQVEDLKALIVANLPEMEEEQKVLAQHAITNRDPKEWTQTVDTNSSRPEESRCQKKASPFGEPCCAAGAGTACKYHDQSGLNHGTCKEHWKCAHDVTSPGMDMPDSLQSQCTKPGDKCFTMNGQEQNHGVCQGFWECALR